MSDGLANTNARLRIIGGVIFASFLAALDTTILATVMPTVAADLGGLRLYGWAFAGYMIATAISMPLWGKLSDVYGKKRLFFAAVVTFLAGSMLCGISPTMEHLIVFRGIQGIGAGGLASIPFALVSTVFPPHERGKALGVLASAWGISSIIGPLLGSAIVVFLHWRWVFYINLPVGTASILMISRYFTEVRPHGREPVDYAGAGVLCITIVSLLIACMEYGNVRNAGAGEVILPVGLFVLFLFIFLRRERAIEHPILELRFFRNRAFWVGNLLGFTASFAMYGIIAFMPLLAQSLHGGTALQAGLVITPMSLGWSAASIVAGRMSHRVGEPLLIRSGMAFMTAGFLLAMMTWAGSPVWFLMLCVGLTGVGMGCQTPALMLTVQQCLEAQNIGVATSTQMLARTIGGAVGVSVMGAAVTGSMVSMIRRLEESGLLASFPASARAHFAEPQKLLDAGLRPALTGTQLDLVLSAFVDALHSVFIIGVIVLVVSIALSFLLPRILTRLSVAGKGGDAA